MKAHHLIGALLPALLMACPHRPSPGVTGGTSATSATSASNATNAASISTSTSALDAQAFRAKPPAALADVPFRPPVVRREVLANGLEILLIEQHLLPVVGMQLVTHHGADAGSPGLATLTTRTSTRGTSTSTAEQIDVALDDAGTTLNAWASIDALGVTVKTLRPELDGALSQLADVTLHPTFPVAEVTRQRDQVLDAIRQRVNDLDAVKWDATLVALFPEGHPYRAPKLGTAASVAKLDRKQLVGFHAARWCPADTTLIVAGDVTASELHEKVEKAFGNWKSSCIPAPVPAVAPAPRPSRIVLVDRPGTSQSQVAVSLVGPARTSPDFAAVMVMNQILGGNLSSRIFLNLREKHGYTYGAYSWFELWRGPSPFLAGGAMVGDKTALALRELLTEIRRIADEPVTAAELDAAKSSLIRALPARFETVESISWTFAQLAIYGVPLDEYETRADRFGAVSLADVQRVAKTYLKLEEAQIVVVGDAKKVKGELEALGVGPVVAE